MNQAATTSGEGADPRVMDFVMATQPIFSKNLDLFAHELLFRKCCGDEWADIVDHDDATNRIIADGFSLASKRLGQCGRVSVNVGHHNILSKNVLALPSDRVILEIPSHVIPTDRFREACGDLKGEGYHFLLDNYIPGNSALDGLIPLADYVKIPAGTMDGRAVAQARKSLSGWKGKLIASRVESWEAFEGCKYLGFDYFQGYFFAFPRDIVGKKISSHKMTRLNLLRALSDDGAELSRIVDIISTDQALSVRLLHFVNSAAFSLGNRVDSLARAASLVGLNALRKWAMTAALSDIDPSGKGTELSYRTMHGALFLSMLGESRIEPTPERETLYLLGLLRNVDALMGMKMKEIVEDMPLDSTVKRALMRDFGEPLSRFVRLADAIWRNDWRGSRELLDAVGVPAAKAARLYMQAGDRTRELMDSMTGAA